MSNIFKSNSRFASLVDDIPKQKNDVKKNKEQNIVNEDSNDERFNSFKSERPIRSESNFKSSNKRERENYRFSREEIRIEKQIQEQEKERIYKESLKIENFPELTPTLKKEVIENTIKISYIEKLKKEEDDNQLRDYEDSYLKNLKPGWLLLKRDPITRKTIFKYHPETPLGIKEKEKQKTDQEIMTEICSALAKLYEKRTQEYIELYGYDTWEKMFKFPDWKEREAYLEAMEELANQTDESDYDDEEYE